jgi:hypothetical protein
LLGVEVKVVHLMNAKKFSSSLPYFGLKVSWQKGLVDYSAEFM